MLLYVLMIEAVVFDWDGTVADSAKLQVECEIQQAKTIAAELGVQLEANAQDWNRFRGWGRANIAAELFGLTPQDPISQRYRLSVIDSMVETMGPHNLTLTDRVLHFISLLRRRSCPRAVATSSNRIVLDASLSFLGLEDEFQTTVAWMEGLDDKPSPGPYNEAVRRLDLNAPRTLAIEDSATGITAARRAGMLVMGVATTSSVKYLQTHTSAHLVAENFEHAAYLLEPLLRQW